MHFGRCHFGECHDLWFQQCILLHASAFHSAFFLPFWQDCCMGCVSRLNGCSIAFNNVLFFFIWSKGYGLPSPDIGSHTVQPASARCPEPRLFGGWDGGLWEWPGSSCHSLVGSFKIEFVFFFRLKYLFNCLWQILMPLSKLPRMPCRDS
jgi:hypothetical protein